MGLQKLLCFGDLQNPSVFMVLAKPPWGGEGFRHAYICISVVVRRRLGGGLHKASKGPLTGRYIYKYLLWTCGGASIQRAIHGGLHVPAKDL